jgi:hypothetical protein
MPVSLFEKCILCGAEELPRSLPISELYWIAMVMAVVSAVAAVATATTSIPSRTLVLASLMAGHGGGLWGHARRAELRRKLAAEGGKLLRLPGGISARAEREGSYENGSGERRIRCARCFVVSL